MAMDAPDLGNFTIDTKWRVGIVRSLWHGQYTSAFTEDAKKELIDQHIAEENIFVVDAAGTYEVPLLCRTLIEHKNVDAIIAHGIVVHGETHHADLITQSACEGIMRVQMAENVPIINELLLVDDLEQAKERTTGAKAKGAASAKVLLHTLAAHRLMQE